MAPLAFGLLGGAFTKETELDANDWRQSVPLFQEENYAQTITKVDALKQFAGKKCTSLPNLALAWLLAQDGVDAVIPGGKRKERIRENVKASEMELSIDELNVIEQILN